jgi:hypothetical protein
MILKIWDKFRSISTFCLREMELGPWIVTNLAYSLPMDCSHGSKGDVTFDNMLLLSSNGNGAVRSGVSRIGFQNISEPSQVMVLIQALKSGESLPRFAPVPGVPVDERTSLKEGYSQV